MVAVALLSWGTISHIGATNNGQHTGYVTAVEQEGLIWKTWRIYLKTDPRSSQEDSYCVTNPDVVSQLQNVEQNREQVTVIYSSPFLVWKWECGGESSIVKSVALLGGVSQQSSDQGQNTNVDLKSKCADDGKKFVQNYEQANNASNAAGYRPVWFDPQFHYNSRLNTCLAYIGYGQESNEYGSMTPNYTIDTMQVNAIYDIYSNQAVLYSLISRETTSAGNKDTLLDSPYGYIQSVDGNAFNQQMQTLMNE